MAWYQRQPGTTAIIRRSADPGKSTPPSQEQGRAPPRNMPTNAVKARRRGGTQARSAYPRARHIKRPPCTQHRPHSKPSRKACSPDEIEHHADHRTSATCERDRPLRHDPGHRIGDQGIAPLSARHDRIRPRGVVGIEACGAPAMAKTHRCPATSTRFCFVAQAVICARLLLLALAGTEEKSEPAR
jgi:hypothetical protein